jgi:hypothetical protein
VGFVLAYAGALSATGRSAEAAAALERARADGRGRRRLLEALVRARARLGQDEAVEDALARLRGMAEGSSSALARASLLEGEAQERMGHRTAAVRAYREADRYDPRCGALERAARVLRRSGSAAQLYQIYSTLCLRNGPSSPACGAARRVETSARRALP